MDGECLSWKKSLATTDQFGYAKLAFQTNGEVACYTIFKNELVELIGQFSSEASEEDGWMNQAYSRLSTTHGHITDCKLLVCMY